MKMFLFFVKTLLFGWLVALIELCGIVKRWCARSGKGKVPTRHRLCSHQ
jgi:hypothetical protein